LKHNVVYDTAFIANEWYVVAMIAVGTIAFLAFPKRFSPTQTLFSLLYGVALWVGLALLVEWIGLRVGLFHYKDGYKLVYSVPIYAFVQCILVFLFQTVFRKPASAELSAPRA